MTLRLLCFSIGIILVGYLPVLPSFTPIFIFISIIGLIFFTFRKYLTLLITLSVFLAGLSFGVFSGKQMLALQIPEALTARDLVVEGMVIDLPQENDRRQLFTLKVHSATLPHDLIPLEHFPHKINLSSYGDIRVKSGEHWRLTVKLKKPRGFVNPGGFDYQAFLLRNGVGATGYIREGDNRLLQDRPLLSIDVFRYRLQQWLIQTSQSSQKSILVALLVGDTSLVDKNQWNEMIKTGTNHLIAISGLHLGFFAIVGFFVGNLIGRCIQIFWHKYPSMISGYICSMLFTAFYSLIAGFNIPTIRTLIMLAVVQLALLWRRSFRVRDTLMIALVLVLLYDPLAAYDIGFWLSFGAVAMLIFCFTGRFYSGSKYSKPYFKHLGVFIKSQWVMFIGLLIPLSLLVHTSSLLAPPANLVAIPVITFFVVPCLILSAAGHFLLDSWWGLDDFFLRCAELGLTGVHKWLNYLLAAGEGKFNPLININFAALFVAIPAVLLILLPRGVGSKSVGFAGILFALCVPFKNLPALQLLVFDVGQGTAVLIQTPHHQLLYDTGPRYTENFDAGSGIVVPYLHSQGIRGLGALIVSHNDQDHSGGLNGVQAATEIKRLLSGEPDKLETSVAKSCHEESPWIWDGIRFSFITWPPIVGAKANNRSCVLLVEYDDQKILLTGDIEKEVEHLLLAQQSLFAVDILLAPHHGSRTSSTFGFIDQVKPGYVIYSAGFRNQHGHPHKDIQSRYTNVGSIPLNTATGGALEFVWDQGVRTLQQHRLSQRRYWFE